MKSKAEGTGLIKRPKIVVTFLSLTVVCLFIFIIVNQTRAASANIQLATDNSEIKSVVTETFASSVTLLVVPEPTTGVNASTMNSATTVASLSDTVKLHALASMVSIAHSRVQNRFNAIFTSKSLIGKTLYSEIQSTIDGQTKGRYRALGGGISNIHWDEILINNDQASVTVDATLWSRVKYIDEKGKIHTVTPTTGYVKVFTLQRINGHWLVDDIVNNDLRSDLLVVNHKATNNINTVPTDPEAQSKIKAAQQKP